jgi:fibronectin-binding autotransporter adhesin
MNEIKNRPITTVWYAFALAALAITSTSAQNYWMGTGGSLNWSASGNWSSALPDGSSILNFEDVNFATGYTNGAGLVNNIVDSSMSTASARYTATATGGNLHFYTTLIPSGVTLSLNNGLGYASPVLAVGDVPWSGAAYNISGPTNYTTITGAGTLALNDSAALMSVGMRNRATLDLSGLNNFTANVKQVWVASSGDNPNSSGPTGALRLAKTNTITTAANLDAPGILLGSVTNGSGTAFMFLGGVNRFNTDGLVAGGLRAGFGTLMSFGPGYSNSVVTSTFTLRGSAGGSTPASLFAIGDLSGVWDSYHTNHPGSISGGSSSSIADFSGGMVDILADSLYIGRSAPNEVATVTSASQGTLIVEQGTVTATNVYIANKITAANGSAAQGTLVLRSNATMNVVKDLSLCFRTNGSAFINFAQLFVSNSAVLNVGGNITCLHSAGSWVPANITLGGNGAINMTGGGTVFTPVLNGVGYLTNAGNVTVTNSFSINTDFLPGTLRLGNNLTMGNPFQLTFNLGVDNTVGGGVNDYLDIANNVTFNNNPLNVKFTAPLVAGTYKLVGYGGTQSGSVTWVNPTRSPIGLVQGSGQVALIVTNYAPGTVIWKATSSGNGNWESTTTNWNNNTDRFFTLDNVVFDDTGLATNVAIASITNFPSSVVFNNSTKKYTVTQSGSGAIGGFGGLTKNGTGTLVMGGGGLNNYFIGPVNLNQGTLQMGSFNTGVLGVTDSTDSNNNVINIANGATLDLNGNSLGSGGSYARYVNVIGTGATGAGAIINGAASNPTLATRDIVLTGDTTFGCPTGPRLGIAGTLTPYGSLLNLGGYTLTTSGAGFTRLNQLTITNSGSIVVGPGNLEINSLILDGPGTLNLGSRMLSFYTSFTTGYVAKAISVSGGAISAISGNATPIPLQSPISITGGGSLTITNSQPIVALGVISGLNGSLTKWGTANLVMTAASTYSGPTTISGGRLVLNPGASLASTLVQVDAAGIFDVSAFSGGYTIPGGQNLAVSGSVVGDVTATASSTLSGFGSINGSVTVTGNGNVSPGSALVQGTLGVGNNLTFTRGTTIFKLGSTTTPGAGINDLIAVQGNLSFNGPTKIRIQPVAGLSGLPYTLFTYTGTLSGVANLSVTSDTRYNFTLDTVSVPGSVLVSVSGSAGNLVWSGGDAGDPSAWDIIQTTNWLNGATPDAFYQGDAVTFDNTGLVNLVTMAAQMKPSSITNNASGTSGTYVLNGSGSLLAGALVANNGNLILANTNSANLFNGEGIIFNGGNVTLNQPTNASLQAKLSGSSGTLTKNGTNTLTLSTANSLSMNAAVNINAGTLRPASSNALGAGTISIASGGTLDLNGQVLNAGTVHAAGVGADGQGTINNRGIAQTNAISALTLDGDATLGAASNRWDLIPGGTLQGNGFNLTKIGPADIWLQSSSGSGLSNIDVLGGRLIFGGAANDLGESVSSVLTVHSNATFGFAGGIQGGAKAAVLQAGSSLYAINGGNRFDGPAILINGLVLMEPNATLALGGNLTGPGTLNLRGNAAGNFGTLTLEGKNTYTGGTVVNDGMLIISNSFSLPANTNVTLSSRVAFNTSGHPILSLASNVITSTNVLLDMQTIGSVGAAQATLDADGGTWAGPIRITGNLGQCQARFSSGYGGLVVSGAVDGTAFFGNGNNNGGVYIAGDNVLVSDPALGGVGVRFNNSLQFVGTMNCINTGLGGFPGMTKLVLGASGNSWTNMFWSRGVIQIAADNALPLTPIGIGSLAIGADHRVVLDLNGHSQGLASWTERFTGNDPAWFGNSSTNANAVLTYAGIGTNSWTAYILDAFDTNAPIQKQTALNVTAGVLKLVKYPSGDPSPSDIGYFPSGPPPYPFGMTYTGPTTITGGLLEVDKGLGISPVTVSGAGTLGGTGVISGPVVIATGGKLSPGASIGTLAISNNLTINTGGSCFIEVNLALATNSDRVLGISSLVCNGTITLTNVGVVAYTSGTTLKLFDAVSYSGSGVSIQPTSPGTNLMWDASQLAVDGTLRVVPWVAPVVSSPTKLGDKNIAFNISGTVGQGYTVRASTNAALPITNWSILQSGSLPASPYSFTDLSATNYSQRFYRVSTP